MKIAAIQAEGRGETDRLISQCAAQLQAEGITLSGIVKVLQDLGEDAHHCDMEVQVLPQGQKIRITQSLGKESTACRLNPEAIAQSVAAVEAAASRDTQMFVLNKFGPEEAEGRGFRNAIGAALDQGVPVLLGVNSGARDAFDAFAGDMATTLPGDPQAILAWCRAALAEGG